MAVTRKNNFHGVLLSVLQFLYLLKTSETGKLAAVSNITLTVLNSPPRIYGTLSSDSTISNQTGGGANVTYLLNNLLKQYDNSLRPDLGGPPLPVEINMQVRSMGPISEIDMSYSMDCYFRQSWVDKRLSFSGQKTLALSIEMLRKIWKPDTYIFNGRKSYLHTITTPNRFMRLFPNGRVLYSQRLTIRASCQMDLSDFPMDKQKCPLLIGSFGYTNLDLVYRWTEGRGVNIASDMKLSQFDLISTPMGNTTTFLNKGLHSTLLVSFHLQRHMGNFVIQVYGPCVLLVVISWVSFWLNREATSDRISLGVTTVLTMTFLGLEARTDLPEVSYPTALDYFVFISFMFIFSTVVQFALVHYFTKVGSGEYYLEDLEETDCMAAKIKNRKNLIESSNQSTADEVSCIGNVHFYKGNGETYRMMPMQQQQQQQQQQQPQQQQQHGNYCHQFCNNCRHAIGALGAMQREPCGSFEESFCMGSSRLDSSESDLCTHSLTAAGPLSAQTLQLKVTGSGSAIHQATQLPTPVLTPGIGAIFSEEEKALIKHNCLNHHPYSSFYYNKKTGRTGRRLARHNLSSLVITSNGNSPSRLTNRRSRQTSFEDEDDDDASVSDNLESPNLFLHRENEGVDDKETQTKRKPVCPGWLGIIIGKISDANEKRKREKAIRAKRQAEDECRCKRCIIRSLNNPEKALNSVSQIDKISRIVFPLSFFTLNAFYWYTYLKHSERIELQIEAA